VSGVDGNGLSLRTGEVGRFSVFILLDVKVREMEFVGGGRCVANGGLDVGDGGGGFDSPVAGLPAVPAVGDKRRLLVFGVFPEHAPIVLRFRKFEEAYNPFFQWCQM
jgi:hypothetical protein